jgi:hypothetical protein
MTFILRAQIARRAPFLKESPMAMMSDTSEMRTSYAAKTTRRYFVLAVTAALLLISFIVDV